MKDKHQLDYELDELTKRYNGAYSLFHDKGKSTYEIRGVPEKEIKKLCLRAEFHLNFYNYEGCNTTRETFLIEFADN